MSRINVIDSSVLLSEGKNAIYGFGSDKIVIPLVVISEVANKRNDPDLGYQAREVLREITKLKSEGDINTGIKLENGGELRVEVNHIDSSNLPPSVAAINNNDIRILAVAHSLTEEEKDVVLVTQDITLQILAAVVNVTAEAFIGTKQTDKDQFIKAIPEMHVDDIVIEELYDKGIVHLETDIPINTAVLFKKHDESGSALAICKAGWVFQLVSGESKIGKFLEARGKEQAVAINYLMDESIGVVSLGGRAGSGKSMLALAAALQLVKDKKAERIVIFRPMNAVGGSEQEIGFLPGTIDEKLAPIMEPVFDALGTFMNKIDVEKIKRDKTIEFRSIAHARGSSLNNTIIIVDEVQNLSKSTIGTLLTRAGACSRVFLCWDVAQTDSKYIGKYEGIFKVVRFLLGKKLFAHVSLVKSQRSAVAEMASEILEDMN